MVQNKNICIVEFKGVSHWLHIYNGMKYYIPNGFLLTMYCALLTERCPCDHDALGVINGILLYYRICVFCFTLSHITLVSGRSLNVIR